jgi:hypothetical protein
VARSTKKGDTALITFVGRDAETESEYERVRDAHPEAFIVNAYPSARVYHVAPCGHLRDTRSETAYPKHVYFSLPELRTGHGVGARACLDCNPDSHAGGDNAPRPAPQRRP